jgi:hypothetical protein
MKEHRKKYEARHCLYKIETFIRKGRALIAAQREKPKKGKENDLNLKRAYALNDFVAALKALDKADNFTTEKDYRRARSMHASKDVEIDFPPYGYRLRSDNGDVWVTALVRIPSSRTKRTPTT